MEAMKHFGKFGCWDCERRYINATYYYYRKVVKRGMVRLSTDGGITATDLMLILLPITACVLFLSQQFAKDYIIQVQSCKDH